MTDAPPTPAPDSLGWLRTTLRILIPLVIIAGATAIAGHLYRTRPRAERGAKPPMTALVHVQPVQRQTETVVLHGQGTVVPAREITLKSRVAGEIIAVSDGFVDGGVVTAGAEIARIDPVDYELAVARAEAMVASAEFEAQLEQGQRQVAEREWELMGAGDTATDRERALALREPHRKRVEASLKAAQADMKQSQLNLERTSVRAPFNGLILSRHAELGARVSTQDPLATLVGTDEYWVRVSIPADRLEWLSLPSGNAPAAAKAHITPTSGGATREGRVIRLLGDLEARGRMARLLVSVQDPMGLKGAGTDDVPLLLGSYVQVELEGRQLENIVKIPRDALRDNAFVWVVDARDALDIREVEVAWRGPETVLIKDGVSAGDRLVVSDIAAPIEGMPLQVADSPAIASATADSEDH